MASEEDWKGSWGWQRKCLGHVCPREVGRWQQKAEEANSCWHLEWATAGFGYRLPLCRDMLLLPGRRWEWDASRVPDGGPPGPYLFHPCNPITMHIHLLMGPCGETPHAEFDMFHGARAVGMTHQHALTLKWIIYRNLYKHNLQSYLIQTKIPEPPGHLHAFGHFQSVTVWLRSQWPGQTLPSPMSPLMTAQGRMWFPCLGHWMPIYRQGWQSPLVRLSSISVSSWGSKVLITDGQAQSNFFQCGFCLHHLELGLWWCECEYIYFQDADRD